ncbi:hypothetical protein [Methanosarcina sp. 1.H.T.1A.1]|uniref:hypothetical protein n=1 Tax=Methanosarcina sp. 1.H.T.1A.1 TaxID=1483602 RepID=UPI00138DF4FB|nr:hypothetical protein [Methanosarcina sp. 1.H.T.1A.1]
MNQKSVFGFKESVLSARGHFFSLLSLSNECRLLVAFDLADGRPRPSAVQGEKTERFSIQIPEEVCQ